MVKETRFARSGLSYGPIQTRDLRAATRSRTNDNELHQEVCPSKARGILDFRSLRSAP